MDERWPMLPEPAQPPAGGDHRNTRKGKWSIGQRFDLNAALRSVAIIRLKAEGKSYQEIANQLGYKSDDAVREAYQTACKRYIGHKAQEYAQVILAEHVADVEMAQSIIENPGYKTDVKGSLITGPDGEWQEDEYARTAALTEKRKTLESIRRMVGTDAPKQTEVQIKADLDLNQRIQVTLERYKELMAGKIPTAPAIQLPDEDIVEAEDVVELESDEPDAGAEEG